MGYFEEYRELCRTYGIEESRQADFEAATTTLVDQTNSTTATQQLASAYAGQAASFGVPNDRVGAFLAAHKPLGEKYKDELKVASSSAAGVAAERNKDVAAAITLAQLGTGVIVAVIIVAIIYLAVDKFHEGGWGGLYNDLKEMAR